MFSKLIEEAKSLYKLIKTVPQEADGTGSASRVICLVCSAAAVGGFVFHIYVNRALPTHDQMLGLGVLLGAGQAAYVANQVRASVADKPQVIAMQQSDGLISTHASGFASVGEETEDTMRVRPGFIPRGR